MSAINETNPLKGAARRTSYCSCITNYWESIEWRKQKYKIVGLTLTSISIPLSLGSTILAEQVKHISNPIQDTVGILAIVGSGLFLATSIAGVYTTVRHYAATGYYEGYDQGVERVGTTQ